MDRMPRPKYVAPPLTAIYEQAVRKGGLLL